MANYSLADGSRIIWSIILLLHPLASNFGGLLTLRIFLGIFESAITPGFSLITSMWYKPSEHASRHAVWFAGNSCSAIFGGLLSYAIAHISGVAAWKVSNIPFLEEQSIDPQTDLIHHFRRSNPTVDGIDAPFPPRQPQQGHVPQ